MSTGEVQLPEMHAYFPSTELPRCSPVNESKRSYAIAFFFRHVKEVVPVSFFCISHVRTAALLGLLVGAVRSVDGCAASSVFVPYLSFPEKKSNVGHNISTSARSFPAAFICITRTQEGRKISFLMFAFPLVCAQEISETEKEIWYSICVYEYRKKRMDSGRKSKFILDTYCTIDS